MGEIRSERNIRIAGSAGLPVMVDVFYKVTGVPKEVVIFSHGFKGFKDWGHFNRVAERFAAEDFVFIKFNFSHNGTTPADPLNFGDLEAFGRNNYIIELDDLKQVLDWVEQNQHLRSEMDVQHLYLLGHSRGGGISIIKAHEDRRVRKLVTWASVSDFVNRNKKRTLDTWKKDGVVYAHNGRTNQNMPLYLQFYEILQANRTRLNVLGSARQLEIPFLIVHGEKDEAVPFHEAEMLHKSAKHSKLLQIAGGTHTFGASHPFETQELPAQAESVVQETIRFFKKM